MAKKRNADFSAKTIKELQKRVAFICSNPGCGELTCGPKQGDPEESMLVGEAGHITAASVGGARFDPELKEDQRAGIDNGIWLCRRCHKIVDADDSFYSVQILREWKKQAEKMASLKLQRSIENEERPSLLIISHESMGALAGKSLTESSPGIFTSVPREEINLRFPKLQQDQEMKDLRSAVSEQLKVVQKVDDLVHQFRIQDIVYHGIVHIPLAFHLGHNLSRGISPHFYEKSRVDDTWHYLNDEDKASLIFKTTKPKKDWTDCTDAVIRISTSYRVTEEQTLPIVNTAATFDIVSTVIKTDNVTNRAELQMLATEFAKLLDEIGQQGRVQRIHVFAAIPVSAAFLLGQQLRQTVHPDTIIYNFNRSKTPNYHWGISIGKDVQVFEVTNQ